MADFHSLEPQYQQIALAYAQSLFTDWLSQHRDKRDARSRSSAFLNSLDEGVMVAFDIRQHDGL